MDIQKIKVDELKLSDIVNEFSKGQIRIPRFQRNYVWDRPRVVKLLNSIYKEYPIGTFFFWEAPSEYARLYRNIPELNIPEISSTDSFKFILDGQQRITSLYVTIKGLNLTIQDSKQNNKKINYSEITFDLDGEEFVVKKPDNERFISLASVLDQDMLDLYDKLNRERKISFNRCYKIFSSYPLSVVYVRDQDLVRACEIFERINQGGVKLRLFDLVVANTWSDKFDLKLEVERINKDFEASGFGPLDSELYLQTLSLLSSGQATRAAQLKLEKEVILKNWSSLEKAFKLAVDFLISNLGVKIYDFLPYRNMLPMIAYFYIKTGNRSITKKQKEFIEEWFWKCTFSERYNTSTPTFMGEDRRNLFDPVIKGKKVKINYPITLDLEKLKDVRIYRSSGLRNGILCLLAQNNPRHFKNGSVMQLNKNTLSDFNSTERHHIFPRAFLQKINLSSQENSIVNLAFIPAELNKEISSKSPNKYFSYYKSNDSQSFDKILKSHFISSDPSSSIWLDNYLEFMNQRGDLLLKAIKNKVGEMSLLQSQLDEDPNQAIDSLEENFRAIIDDNLVERYGKEYWKVAIPGDIQENIKNRISENKSRYPDKNVDDNLAKLSFCDMDDYRKIISTNWPLFEDEFVSKGEFERNFIYLIDYRNGIRHVRELTPIERKHGEAAVEWFILKIKEIPDNPEEEN